MSDVKWTPGPWLPYFGPKGSEYPRPGIEAKEVSIVVFGYGKDDEMEGVKGETVDEAHANANLIAAAPDLYESLEQLRAWALDNHTVPTEIVADVEYALAKARGDQ